MKKYVCCFILSVVVLTLVSGCVSRNRSDMMTSGRAKWISESPDIWFLIEDWDWDDPENNTNIEFPKGEMTVGGEVISFHVVFLETGSVAFVSDDDIDEYFIFGRCTVSPEKLIVEVYKDPDTGTYFDGETIEFIRTPIED